MFYSFFSSLARSRNFSIIIFLASFSHQLWLMVFHLNLSDSKSPQVFRILLSILVNLNNVVVWMVLICPLISYFTSPLSKSLGTVPRALITIGIAITLIFHCFLCSLARSKYLSLSSLSLIVVCWNVKFSFLFIITKSGFLIWIWWSICFSKFKRLIMVCAYSIN